MGQPVSLRLRTMVCPRGNVLVLLVTVHVLLLSSSFQVSTAIILYIKTEQLSRVTFASCRGFLSASRLMDDREWPQERRASSLT